MLITRPLTSGLGETESSVGAAGLRLDVAPRCGEIRGESIRLSALVQFSGALSVPVACPYFNYSVANKNSGIVWDEDTLRKYLAAPQSVVPGTKMTFLGLTDPQQVEDVIAYLKEATKTN